MTEQQPESGPRAAQAGPGDPLEGTAETGQEHLEPVDSPTTGVPAVDEALAEVEGVEAFPLEEQLAAFGRAHDRLRSALDAEPGDPA